jgi:ABC-type lipoprotein export system ATPase subunit
MFTLEGITHRYGVKPVLALSHWQAAQGEHVLVLGPSGSGKTTLLHIIAGVLTPSAGNVRVAGQTLRELGAGELDRFRGRHIGIVFQRLHLLPSLSVFENIQLAQYLAGVPQSRQRVLEVLASLNLVGKESAYPHSLSYGEAQRVALARALVNTPRVILADEPTSNLDDAHCEQVLQLLDVQANACEATLVIATHDQRVRRRIAKQLELG